MGVGLGVGPGAAATVNDRLTGGAGSQSGSAPAWDATTVHVPAARSDKSFPSARQTDGVAVVNETGKPLEAVADKVTGESVTDRSDSGEKSIV